MCSIATKFHTIIDIEYHVVKFLLKFLILAIFVLIFFFFFFRRLTDSIMDMPAEIVEYEGEPVDEKTPLLLSDVHPTYSDVKT